MDYKVDHLKIDEISILPDDLQVRIDGDRLIVDCDKVAWRGHGRSTRTSKKLFDRSQTKKEAYVFDMNVKKGGVKMHMEFKMDHQYIDKKLFPFLKLDKSHFDLDSSLIVYTIRSDNFLGKLASSFVKGFSVPLVKSF